MAKETKAQQASVERVMHEFKHGELKGADRKPISNPRQAIAIGLSEAGASNRVDPATNRRNQARTRREERQGDTARQAAEGADATAHRRSALYAEARRRDVPGRSRMNKAQLERALHGG